MDKLFICKFLVAYFVTQIAVNLLLVPSKKRKRNICRDRLIIDQKIDLWSDALFKRQFRLNRECFMYLLIRIDERFPITEKSKHFAMLSSGSFISNKLRLYITLRILAGASYLDMVWYEVNINHVNEIVIDMSKKIDIVLDNINFPNCPEELKQILL